MCVYVWFWRSSRSMHTPVLSHWNTSVQDQHLPGLNMLRSNVLPSKHYSNIWTFAQRLPSNKFCLHLILQELWVYIHKSCLVKLKVPINGLMIILAYILASNLIIVYLCIYIHITPQGIYVFNTLPCLSPTDTGLVKLLGPMLLMAATLSV